MCRLQGKAAPAAAVASGARAGAGREVEVLPSVDAQGRAVAGAFGREAAGQGALPPGELHCNFTTDKGTPTRW